MIFYVIYSATKMVLYATLIPFEIGEDIQLNFYQDLIKALILLTELIFLYQSLKSKNNFSEDQAYLRVITVALGWSFAESLINNLFYYLFNSMGEEFTWEYIRTAILANVQMIEKMAIVALIQTGTKLREEKKSFTYIIFLICFKYIFNNFAYIYIPALNFGGDQWKILLSKMLNTVVFSLIVKKIFKNANKTVEELAEEEYIKMKKKK